MGSLRKAFLALALVIGGISGNGGSVAEDKAVAIGYQHIYNPWKVAIANGGFESATGYDIVWKTYQSGAGVINAMAAGEVQIALAGSSPIAAGTSRGLPIQLFWIAEDIAAAEALVVREGSGIVAPQDLIGKTLAVPFVSTAHFHTLFALDQFGIDPADLRILNLQPNVIAAAWNRGDIDAAFVWDPTLSRIKRTGKVLITSGQLSNWGKATFDGLVVDRDWAAANPDFMVAFVETVAAADVAYRDNPEAWTADSRMVKAIVDLIGGDAEDVPGALALYAFPTLEEQASERWLGGGADGGAAQALYHTALFLKSENKIGRVLPDYASAVTAEWVDKALERAAKN